MHIFINDSTLKPDMPTESNLKYRVTVEFYFTHNKIYKNPDSRFLDLRYVV